MPKMLQEEGLFHWNQGEERLLVLHHVDSRSVPAISAKWIIYNASASRKIHVVFLIILVGSAVKRITRYHNRNIWSHHD